MRRIVLTVALASVGASFGAVAVALVVLVVRGGLDAGVVRAPWWVLVFAALAAALLALVVAVWLAERTVLRLDGLVRTLRERADRLAAGDTRPVPLTSGIEELDRLDAALVRGAQQGAKRLASERDFAADASHQLRTPLTALLMRLEEISTTEDLEVVAEESAIAIGQVERLSKVVDDLMGRARSGVEASPSVSLDSVLASLQREWQPPFASARRSIHVSGERGLLVRATPVALGQILTTLLENSLAYGRGTVEISARRAGPSVVIEVSDTGDGVSPALAPHIFERSVSSSGSGLGLSLARDLAEAVGGRLELARAAPPVFALFLSVSDRV
ncbi:HAMP domain-containing sensor histidine kinase [Nostocoides sp. Soil756]|jgi:signal transduction histidine kinase|uniref:sensor histidine kinase n=1 Tax=Nostocoides sp. Soil756 TaxID=1736399 RepID=UPI0006F200DD|nr:HAMP domain-containing sensor histidine kinase [Tetrasphaera sp. Soil756]KRE62227.1 histidine kinase [Tetrasphaera sp. Soil756]